MSYTDELREFPLGRSFVAAAEAAVTQAGYAVAARAYFTAREGKEADYRRDLMRRCDIYVGLIGLRYGPPMRDQPEVSYAELEFDIATGAGLPQLVFLLEEDPAVPIPPGQAAGSRPGLAGAAAGVPGAGAGVRGSSGYVLQPRAGGAIAVAGAAEIGQRDAGERRHLLAGAQIRGWPAECTCPPLQPKGSPGGALDDHKFTVASMISRLLGRMFPELARPPLPGSGCHRPDCPARQQTADAFLGCLGLGQIRRHELEALGCCRGAQRAVEGREFRAVWIDPAHSQRGGQLDRVISSKAMRCAQPGRLVEEAPRDYDGGETRGLRVGPEVISLEIGGKQSGVAGGQSPMRCLRHSAAGTSTLASCATAMLTRLRTCSWPASSAYSFTSAEERPTYSTIFADQL